MSEETTDDTTDASPPDESGADAGAASESTDVVAAGGDDASDASTDLAVASPAGALAVAEKEQRVELRKDRLWLPFLIPIGAILVVALFTVNISRILLAASEESADPAVIVGIILTLAVLVGASVVAAIPKLRTSSLVLTMCGVTAIVMLSGSLTLGAAESHEEAAGPPPGPAEHTLPIEGSNFAFQLEDFKVPAGVTEIKYKSVEGSHTLAFSEPQFSYVNLSVPGGKDAVLAEFVENEKYTIYCTLAGHRASGMEATITVGPPTPGAPVPGTETATTTVIPGETPATTVGGSSEVDTSDQSGDELGN